VLKPNEDNIRLGEICFVYNIDEIIRNTNKKITWSTTLLSEFVDYLFSRDIHFHVDIHNDSSFFSNCNFFVKRFKVDIYIYIYFFVFLIQFFSKHVNIPFSSPNRFHLVPTPLAIRSPERNTPVLKKNSCFSIVDVINVIARATHKNAWS